jgi:D-glycero-D-manno-heptose 1,7-bisphosphate phosphatase
MTVTEPHNVLLDRDGVILRDRPGSIRRAEDVELLPGAAEAIRRLCQAGRRVFVVTNQSVVGRGLVSAATLGGIHDRLLQLVESEFGGIDRVFVCPHHPQAGCACRKPRPGLLFAARDEAGVDLDDAVLIGDMPSDVEAAHAAGCRAIFVSEGKPATQRFSNDQGVPIVPDLAAAVDLLLGVAIPC